MTKALLRSGVTAALIVVLAAGAGAGTASAAPTLAATPGALPAYCPALFKVITRPDLAFLARRGLLQPAERFFTTTCVKPDGSTYGSGNVVVIN